MKNEIVSVTYRIPEQLKIKLKDRADCLGISVNALIIYFLDECLKN